MQSQILVIGVIKKGDSILLRKKPDGSPPYKETWYIFGGQLDASNQNFSEVMMRAAKTQAGVEIRVVEKLWWDAETKPNHHGVETFFIYLDCLCEFVSGELNPAEGIEKLEWVPIDKLNEYELVPPSVKLFKRLGYLD